MSSPCSPYCNEHDEYVFSTFGESLSPVRRKCEIISWNSTSRCMLQLSKKCNGVNCGPKIYLKEVNCLAVVCSMKLMLNTSTGRNQNKRVRDENYNGCHTTCGKIISIDRDEILIQAKGYRVSISKMCDLYQKPIDFLILKSCLFSPQIESANDVQPPKELYLNKPKCSLLKTYAHFQKHSAHHELHWRNLLTSDLNYLELPYYLRVKSDSNRQYSRSNIQIPQTLHEKFITIFKREFPPGFLYVSLLMAYLLRLNRYERFVINYSDCELTGFFREEDLRLFYSVYYPVSIGADEIDERTTFSQFMQNVVKEIFKIKASGNPSRKEIYNHFSENPHTDAEIKQPESPVGSPNSRKKKKIDFSFSSSSSPTGTTTEKNDFDVNAKPIKYAVVVFKEDVVEDCTHDGFFSEFEFDDPNDFIFYVNAKGGEFILKYRKDSVEDFFDPSKNIYPHLITMLENLVKKSEKLSTSGGNDVASPSLVNLHVLPDSEFNRLYLEPSRKKSDLFDQLSSTTVSERFVSFATSQTHGEKLCLEYEGCHSNYSEVYTRAMSVARFLRFELGVKVGEYVGHCMDKSIDSVVIVIGTILAGCVHFPMDVNFSNQQKVLMMKDSSCPVVFVDNSQISESYRPVKKKLGVKISKTIKIIQVDTNRQAILFRKSSNDETIEVDYSPDSIMYVMYTSGSSGGIPKGVKISHRNYMNYMLGFVSGLKERGVQIESYTHFWNSVFDAAMNDIFIPLTNGLPCFIVPTAIRYQVDKFLEYVEERKLPLIDVPPSLVRRFPKNDKILKYVKTIVMGGEALDEESLRFWASRVNLINVFGLTETTVSSHIKLYSVSDSPYAIGTQQENYTSFLLDRFKRVVPRGVHGELYVGGVSCGVGFLNRAELTKEKYITNPFKETERVYRTGDLCCHLGDSDEMLLLGRAERKLKINGLRVDLPAIADLIKSTTEVKDAVVFYHEKELVSFVVLVGKKKTVDGIEDLIRRHLTGKLPSFLYPNKLITVRKYPVNFGGKINRAKLLQKLQVKKRAYGNGRLKVERIKSKSANEKSVNHNADIYMRKSISSLVKSPTIPRKKKGLVAKSLSKLKSEFLKRNGVSFDEKEFDVEAKKIVELIISTE